MRGHVAVKKKSYSIDIVIILVPCLFFYEIYSQLETQLGDREEKNKYLFSTCFILESNHCKYLKKISFDYFV